MSVEVLAALGGTAPVDVVEQRLARRAGIDAARLAVGLAIVAGHIERITLGSGAAGLRLAPDVDPDVLRAERRAARHRDLAGGAP